MILPALILNDYFNKPYAQWVKEGKKKIETREGRLFKFLGDVIICCGAGKSVGPNDGRALCIVNIWKARDMLREDIEAACIEWSEERYSYLLKDWRHFSEDFIFKHHVKQRNFQGIFKVEIPSHITIIPRPDIIPYKEKEYGLHNELFSIDSFF